MQNKNSIIKIERFTDKNYIKKDCFVILSTIILLLIFSLVEKNLFLPDTGLGLLEHTNIWIFFIVNFSIIFVININIKKLEQNIDNSTFEKLQLVFEKTSKCKLITIIWNFARTIGFCFFVGNSLQNAHLINPLPFDFWDSSYYIMSYIISRLYKFYLFVNFIPVVFVYIFIFIKSTSQLLIISENDMLVYPIKNYMQLNDLCNFGLNIILAIVIPILCFSSNVYLVHNRFDITTITTIVVSFLCTIMFLGMYILLVNKYYVSVIKYRKYHIEKIDLELTKINNVIFVLKINISNNQLLEAYLKKEKYLRECIERINKISKYPLIFKAFFTIVAPCIPSLMKLLFSAIKSIF